MNLFNRRKQENKAIVPAFEFGIGDTVQVGSLVGFVVYISDEGECYVAYPVEQDDVSIERFFNFFDPFDYAESVQRMQNFFLVEVGTQGYRENYLKLVEAAPYFAHESSRLAEWREYYKETYRAIKLETVEDLTKVDIDFCLRMLYHGFYVRAAHDQSSHKIKFYRAMEELYGEERSRL